MKRRRLPAIAIATAIASLAASGEAVAASAVAQQEPELSPAVTVWCLGNPDRFRVAARGLDLDIGTETNPGDSFKRHGESISLYAWAKSDDPEDRRDFRAACRQASQAFSQPIAQAGESSDESDAEAWIGVIGAGVGAVTGAGLTAAGGRSKDRRRSHQDDAGELLQLSEQFREAVGRYAAPPHPAYAEQEARAKGRALRDMLGEWRKHSGAEQNVTEAQGLLDKALSLTDPPPRIGDLGEESVQAKNGKLLMENTGKLHAHVSAVASKVASYWRKGGRVPGPPSKDSPAPSA